MNVITDKVCQDGTGKYKQSEVIVTPNDQTWSLHLMIKSDHYYLTIKNKSDHYHLTIKRDCYYIMKLQVSSDPPRDRGEAVNTQPWLPKREVQRSNRDTHRQDVCWTGVWHHSPCRKWGARMLTCVNILYVIQITWRNDWVNDLINRKHVIQLMCQKCFKADSDFRVPHQNDASLTGPSGADNWVPRALLSSILLFYLRFSFFPFVSFTLEWS